MIKKQKTQLYNLRFLIVPVLLIPLIGLFVYATYYQQELFLFLGIALSFILVFLLFFRNRLMKRQSSVKLLKEDYLEKINLLEATINKEKEVVESLRNKIVGYSQLKGLTENLSMCLSTNDTTKTLSTEVNKLFGTKDTTIILYLFHPKTGELGIAAAYTGKDAANIKLKQGDLFDQWVIKTAQPLLVEDVRRDFRFDVDKIKSIDGRRVRSLISVPLMIGHKGLGVLRLDSPKEWRYTTEDLRLLMTIGDLGAVAIENAELYEKVEDLAIKDSLTGLYLKRYLLERMTQEMSRELRRKTGLSFLMIDLDKFKSYNDKFGHVAGDIVLKTVGSALTGYFTEPGDMICRFGGEEFAVMMPECSKKDAVKKAEEIRKMIDAHTITLRREKSRITVSIGVATFPEDAQLRDELIHKADAAMYKAKQKGRNKVCAA